MPRKENRSRPSSAKRDRRYDNIGPGPNEERPQPQPNHPNPLYQPPQQALINLMPQNIDATIRMRDAAGGNLPMSNQNIPPGGFNNSAVHAQIAELLRSSDNNPVTQTTAASTSAGISIDQPSKSSRHRRPSSHSHSVAGPKSTSNSNSAFEARYTYSPSHSTSDSQSALHLASSSDAKDSNTPSNMSPESASMFPSHLESVSMSPSAFTSKSKSSSNSPTHSLNSGPRSTNALHSSPSNAHISDRDSVELLAEQSPKDCNSFLSSIVTDDFEGLRIDDSNAGTSEQQKNALLKHTPCDEQTNSQQPAQKEAQKNEEREPLDPFFVGIDSDIVRCIWEQGKYYPLNVPDETFESLAEDASYKLWELIDALRSYTLHSGGVATKHLVNEVLKDFNVHPITYADVNRNAWQKFGCDENKSEFYAKPQTFLDVNDQCDKREWVRDFGTLGLEAEWRTPAKPETIKEYMASLMVCSMLGSERTFRFALNRFATSPFVGSMLPALLTKLLEYISFEPSKNQLLRTITILRAIACSYYSRDVTIELKQFHMANVLVCLLFGSREEEEEIEVINTVCNNSPSKGVAPAPQPKNKSSHKRTPPTAQQLRDTVLIPWAKWKLQPNRPELTIVEKERAKLLRRSRRKLVTRLRTIWEELEERGSFDPGKRKRLRRNSDDPFDVDCDKCGMNSGQPDDDPDSDASDDNDGNDADKDTNRRAARTPAKNRKGTNDFNNFKLDTQGASPGNLPKISRSSKQFLSSFDSTAAENPKHVNEVVLLIGYLSSKWGHVEHEIVHLLNDRMQMFFTSQAEIQWTQKELLWLIRMINVTGMLGDMAVRELSIYFERFPKDIPEPFRPYLNMCAIYLSRRDEFMYQYLDHICGDGLLPFLLVYPRNLVKLLQNHSKAKPSAKRSHRPQRLRIIRRPPDGPEIQKKPTHRRIVKLVNVIKAAAKIQIERPEGGNDDGASRNPRVDRPVPMNVDGDVRVRMDPITMETMFSERVPPVPTTTPPIRFAFRGIHHTYQRFLRPIRDGRTVPIDLFNRRLVIKRKSSRPIQPEYDSSWDYKLYNI